MPLLAQLVDGRFEEISVEDGLSQSSVYSIIQDRFGYIWLATSDGLNRYDGDKVKVFKAQTSLPAVGNSNFVKAELCEDREGRIWYANETGIYHYDPLSESVKRSHNFNNPSPEVGTIYYSGIAIDARNNFWINNPARGLVRYSLSTGKIDLFAYPGFEKHEYVVEPKCVNGTLILHVPGRKGILTFDTRTTSFKWVHTDLDRLSLSGGEGKLFLIQGTRFSIYDSLTHKIEPVPMETSRPIRHVKEDYLGRLWITTLGDGLHCYLPSLRKSFAFRHSPSRQRSLPFDLTTNMFIDATNNLWVGTDGGGVARLDLKPARFNIFPLSEGEHTSLKDYFIKSLHEDHEGRIWFSTLRSGFSMFDPRDGSLRNFSSANTRGMPPEAMVTCIFGDSRNRMWIGHNHGFGIFNEKTATLTEISVSGLEHVQSLPNNVYKIIEVGDGSLIAATWYGIIRFSEVRGRLKGEALSDFIWTTTGVVIDSSGTLWAVSPLRGLFRGVREGDTYSFTPLKFTGIELRSLHIDETDDKVLWISSGVGLIRYNTASQVFRIYNEKDGIPGGFLYGVLQDDNHNLWMSTNSGLAFMDRATETFRNFTYKDGLQSNEFNTAAFTKGASGTLYFGGINGFNWFRTGAETSDVYLPRADVTSISINDNPFPRDSVFQEKRTIRLKHSQNDLQFGFAVFEYTRPAANKIRYLLEGWDKTWVTTFDKNVRYSNLPPSTYTLRVMGSTSGDVWGPESVIKITIEAPFWKTEAFYAIVFIMLFGSVAGLTKVIAQRKINARLRELEKQQAIMRERERISKDIHDDLGSGLSKIAILSELARHHLTRDEFSNRQLEKISHSSRELIDNLGELIWSNNPANDSLLKLFWYFREHLGGMFDGTATRFLISIPEGIADRPVPGQWRRNMFLVAKEALHNVMKHAEATEVVLEVKLVDDYLHMTIKDNGKGFNSAEKMETGNGLTNMIKRVNDCEGRISFDTGQHSGASVNVIVPLPG